MLGRCIAVSLLLLLGSVPSGGIIAQNRAEAQPDSLLLSVWDQASLGVPLLHTQNTAALWQLPMDQIGRSTVAGEAMGGNFRRPQQPKGSGALHLLTERYQRTDKLFWYGKFAFARSRDQDIAWSSVLDPHRGTPYVLADSIGGDWNKQTYALQAKLATAPLFGERIQAGMGVQYQLATGAKQLDPRPLNYATTLSLSPSLLWHVDRRQQVGISAQYQNFKEDIQIQIRRPQTTHNLYRFKGLSIHDQVIPVSSGANRDYASHLWGTELQYQLQWRGHYSLVASFGYDRLSESTTDGSTLPSPAGNYTSKRMHGQAVLTKTKGNNRQQWILHAANWRDEGTEFHTSYDAGLGRYVVTFSGALYQQRGYRASGRYQLSHHNAGGDMTRMVYAGVDYENRKSDYLYIQPSRQDLSRLSYYVGAQYHVALQWRLWARLGYSHSPYQSLAYTPKAGVNTAAQEVLFPDHDYLSASAGHVQVKAQRILQFARTGKTQWFVQAHTYYEHRLDQTDYTGFGSSRYRIQIGFGAYY